MSSYLLLMSSYVLISVVSQKLSICEPTANGATSESVVLNRIMACILWITMPFVLVSVHCHRLSEIVINEVNVDSSGAEFRQLENTFIELKCSHSLTNLNYYRLALINPCPSRDEGCHPEITFWANLHNFKFKMVC